MKLATVVLIVTSRIDWNKEVTGNTGEGTGETGTDGCAVTGKSGEGIGSTGIVG